MKYFLHDRHKINLKIAFDALLANSARSILTALGIIFGVAAVITMLAIGKGAETEILNQIELVGVNNIVIHPIVAQTEEELNAEGKFETDKKFSKGLDLEDVDHIAKVIPAVQKTSPEIIIETHVINAGRRRSAKLIGVTPSFFDIANIKIAKGEMFSSYHLNNAQAVCIIGSGIKKKFFPGQVALGKAIKCGNQWLTIIGITEEKYISQHVQDNLGIRDFNMDIYTPIKSLLVRYKNRTILKAEKKESSDEKEENKKPTNLNYHQIDKLVVQVKESKYLSSTAEVITRMLKRLHNNQIDFEISIPEQLLKQQQKTKDIFNLVLSAIAGISLLVGGIGIMNIMLASVLERTREIGTRLAIGAQKQDIISQFLFESLLISLSGGIIGILLGVIASFLITKLSSIETIVSLSAIFISFGVAASIGIIFGLSPAKKAANQNPVDSLRYE